MYSAAAIVHKHPGNVTIEQLNEELFPLHVPALIFVAVCMITGIIGNLFVIVIYKRKFRRSNHRYFILFLAVTDLIACSTGMPFLIASLRLPYLMTSDIICKSIRFIHYFVNNSSGLLLVVISIERFRKICRPFRRQLTHVHVLKMCWGVVAFSAVMATPAAVLYTASPIDTGIANLTGYQCYVGSGSATFFRGYMIVLFLETVISIIIFAVIYSFIIRALWKNDQFLSSMRSTQVSYTSSKTHHSSGDDADFASERDSEADGANHSIDKEVESSLSNGSDKKSSESPVVSPISRSQTLYSPKTPGVSENVSAQSDRCLIKAESENGDLNKHKKRHTSGVDHAKKGKARFKDIVQRAKSDPTLNKVTKNEPLSPVGRLAYANVLAQARLKKKRNPSGKQSRATARVTVMLLTVSVFFAIAFVPHLVLMFLANIDKQFLDKLSETELMVFQVFLRIFIINNVVNPIIYFIFDSKFRVYSKEAIRGKCRRQIFVK